MHEEYIRIVPGAKTAVLMIHGICGTPNHFRGILPLQDKVPENCSVYNIVLEGHCKTVKDFASSSMEQWKSQVWRVFGQLAQTHEQVVLVAHSMGTLFSIQLGLEFPEKIPFLFLINVPMRAWVRFFGLRNMLRLTFGRLDMDDPIQASTLQVTGVTPTKKLWKYFTWIPRIFELLGEMRRTQKSLPQLNLPAVAFQSRRDELVRNRSETILRKSGKVDVVVLEESTHFYYKPEDIAAIHRIFVQYWETYIT